MLLAVAVATTMPACTTVDPGPQFVVPDEHFDADYFFCHVEPELLVAKKCGPGDPGAGDTGGSCHFNASAVSGLALVDHPPVDCANDHPVNRAQIGAGSAPQNNLQSAVIEMSRDYLSAPIYVRPATGRNHPRQIFPESDPVVDVIRTWAQK